MSTMTAEPGRPAVLSRINPRLVTIAAVFAVLVGYPTYSFVRHSMSGGIEHNGDREDVDLKKLGHFTFDEITDSEAKIPAEDKALDGKKVALEGFVFSPNTASDKLFKFQFVYNVQKCCYGGPPLVQERVFGTLARNADVSASDFGQEVRCIGILHVKLQRDPKTSKCDSIYTMDVQRVEPL